MDPLKEKRTKKDALTVLLTQDVYINLWSAGLPMHPFLYFFPLKDPFCPSSIKGQYFQQIVLYCSEKGSMHTLI